MKNVLGITAILGVLLTATTAFAQQPTDPPPQPPQPPPVDPNPPPRPVVQAQTSSSTSTAKAANDDKKDDGITDHEKVVGKFGVMYFGVNRQPIGQGTAAGGFSQGTVAMPVIGARWWFQEKMGLDLGIGFNFFNSSVSQKTGAVEVSADGPAVLALGLHAGLPLAFATGKHYSFLLVPELNVGYATQTVTAQNVAPGQVAPGDIHLTGFRFDIGARIGSEIQFGFIGIPELSLQASVGLNFRRQSWGFSQDASGTVPETTASTAQNSFGTTVQSDPWALFTNNISAIYYFP